MIPILVRRKVFGSLAIHDSRNEGACGGWAGGDQEEDQDSEDTQGKWWRTMFKASLNGIMTIVKKVDSVKISGVTCGVYQRDRLGMQNQQQMCLRQEGGICGESPAAYRISQQARMS